jgi:geranylgeranyl diphosphate synthase type II
MLPWQQEFYFPNLKDIHFKKVEYLLQFLDVAFFGIKKFVETPVYTDNYVFLILRFNPKKTLVDLRLKSENKKVNKSTKKLTLSFSKNKIMQTIEVFNEQIQKYFDNHPIDGKPSELYDPINYILSLGGKRVRPLMLLMSYNLFEKDLERAFPLAQAIEVFHNFTLIHDDIMDEAPLRRGKETVHKKWDENIGILSGDAMLISAYKLFEALPANMLKNVFPVFNKVAIEVCEGQQYDMNFETRNDVTIAEYIKMITLKTSVLLGGAMKIGALAGNSTIEDAEHLYDFGKYLGVSFQLQDDYLDLYGDPLKFGKRIGGDVVANKKTFLTLKAFAKADDSSNQQLSALFNQTNLTFEKEELKIKSVRDIFNKLDVVNDMKTEINNYYQQALDSLNKVNVDDSNKIKLKLFAQKLIQRDV